MDDSRELRALRSMAWERAKGELASIEHTYKDDSIRFEHFCKLKKDFINAIEDQGIVE